MSATDASNAIINDWRGHVDEFDSTALVANTLVAPDAVHH